MVHKHILELGWIVTTLHMRIISSGHMLRISWSMAAADVFLWHPGGAKVQQLGLFPCPAGKQYSTTWIIILAFYSGANNIENKFVFDFIISLSGGQQQCYGWPKWFTLTMKGDTCIIAAAAAATTTTTTKHFTSYYSMLLIWNRYRADLALVTSVTWTNRRDILSVIQLQEGQE